LIKSKLPANESLFEHILVFSTLYLGCSSGETRSIKTSLREPRSISARRRYLRRRGLTTLERCSANEEAENLTEVISETLRQATRSRTDVSAWGVAGRLLHFAREEAGHVQIVPRAYCSAHNGTVKRTSAPCGVRGDTHNRPPCASMIDRQRARPMPQHRPWLDTQR
jgi:hypothetical protein